MKNGKSYHDLDPPVAHEVAVGLAIGGFVMIVVCVLAGFA